ncbi:MAG: hemolysin family protein [Acidimicrobiia bacterium]|nr:hemolysin family protein [Acidimicrobiia bacterium]
MDAPWLQLVIVAVLVVINGLFSGTEIALISLRQGQLARLEAESETGRIVGRLARDPNQFFATIQIGITLAGFLASAVAAIAIAEPLVEPLGFLGGAAEPVAVILVTGVLTFITLVAGELAPKRVAMQRAERWALLAARPLVGIGVLARPVVLLLSWSTNLVVRLVGGDPDQQREDVTQEELQELVTTQSVLRPDQRSIISGAFEISTRPLREIFVPRREVATLDADMSAAAGLRALAERGHSRAPVIEGDDLDSVIGVAHMRELIADGTVRDAARPAPMIPETVRVLDALNLLRAEREQMAIVIDEHGGAEGMVTVEDLLEEIVGEIYDETDVNVISARRMPDGSLVLPGTFPMHDLVDLGVELPSGDYATVAGLMLDRLGRIPERVGESVVVEGWRLTVRSLQGRAIERVGLRRVAD